MRWLRVAAVTVPPALLAGIGLTHPRNLTESSAEWWTTLHIILLPLFPLLAVAVWIVLRGDRSALAWGARVGATIYVVFYGALDSIAGIAEGTVVSAANTTDTPGFAELFVVAHPFGIIGGYAFFASALLLLVWAWRVGPRGPHLYVATPLLLGGAILLASSHIYWPRGVLAMLAVAIGFGLIEFGRLKRGANRASPEAA
jgi:hypothetical protein